MKIAIIGAGEIGSAINHILPKVVNTVELYDKQPGKVPGQKPLEEVLRDAEIVFMAVPSWVLRAAALDIKPYLWEGSVIACLSKGLEEGTGKTAYEVLTEEISGSDLAIISGPMLGEELMAGRGGAAVVASRKNSTYEKLEKLLTASGLVTSYSDDIRGVSLAGVLKNVYSIGVGMAHSIGWDESLTGWLFDLAFKEMREIITRLSGRPETADSPAGLADLIATGSSDFSNNRQYGLELAGHGSSLVKCEGGVALPSLKLLLGESTEDFQLLSVIERSVSDPGRIREHFDSLKR